MGRLVFHGLMNNIYLAAPSRTWWPPHHSYSPFVFLGQRNSMTFLPMLFELDMLALF